MTDRKAFDRDLNPTPDLSMRIIIGKDGIPSANMELQQLFALLTSNSDVYTVGQIDNLFLNYLSKTNSTPYAPTLDTHPATKGYADGIDNRHVYKMYTITSGTFLCPNDAEVIIIKEPGANVTFPTSPKKGDRLSVRNRANNSLTISGNGRTIDGNASYVMQPYYGYEHIYDGTAWYILSAYTN